MAKINLDFEEKENPIAISTADFESAHACSAAVKAAFPEARTAIDGTWDYAAVYLTRKNVMAFLRRHRAAELQIMKDDGDDRSTGVRIFDVTQSLIYRLRSYGLSIVNNAVMDRPIHSFEYPGFKKVRSALSRLENITEGDGIKTVRVDDFVNHTMTLKASNAIFQEAVDALVEYAYKLREDFNNAP